MTYVAGKRSIENWEYAMLAYLGLSFSSPELSTHAALHCVLQCSEWLLSWVSSQLLFFH